jgi:hypothetical protein
MSRSLMFNLHHLLNTDETVLAEARAKAIYNNICRYFKPSLTWFREITQHKWDSIVLTTPTRSFNNMQTILAECIEARIVITQQDAAIRFASLLQLLSASYILLMQFDIDTENITLSLLWPQVCMTDNLLSRHTTAPRTNSTTARSRDKQLQPRFKAPCEWCGISGHNEERCYQKNPINLHRCPPKNGWITPDGNHHYHYSRNTVIHNHAPSRVLVSTTVLDKSILISTLAL